MPPSLRKCLFAISLIVLSYAGFSQNQVSPSGNAIKSLSIYALKLNKDIEKRTYLDHLIRYERNGYKKEEIFYDSAGLELFKITNLYEGTRLAARVYCTYRDTLARTEYRVDGKGRPKEDYTENAEGVMLSRYVYSCNSSGKIISSEAEINPQIMKLVRLIYRYDEDGFFIYQFLGDSKTPPHLRFSYEYDKAGFVSRIAEQTSDSLNKGAILFEHSKSGLLKEFTVRHTNGKKYKCYYKYNDHGQLKEESRNYYFNTALLDQEKNEFNLDLKGLVKKRLRYRMNNDLFMLYNYSYDYYDRD